MKTLYTLLIATITLLAGGAAQAAGEDLAGCRWANGSAIEPQLCAHMQRKDAEQRARVAGEQAALQTITAEEQARQATRAAQQALAEAQARQAAAAQTAEQQALAERLARTQAQDAADETRALAERESRRKECGADFGKPRVGMGMDRARQCVGDFNLVSQINRVDGVVSVYRAGRLVVHAMGGRIAAWSVY